MDINILNDYITEIYNNKTEDKYFFELLLVNINNIIDNSAKVFYPNIKDKLLYDFNDFKQEILIELWLYLSNNLIAINSINNLYSFINNLINSLIIKLNN